MLKLKKTITICALALSISFGSYAKDLQRFTVHNNDTVIAIISEKEISRFVFKGDKVKKVLSIGGQFHYEKVDGDLYIKPNIQKPLNFFVKTENNNTYKIIATPKDIPATQIYVANVISIKSSQVKDSLTGESVYQAKISKIIKVVKAEDVSVGYESESIGKSSKKNNLSDYFDSEWWGDGMIAEKHFLFNDSSNSVKINKGDYLDDDTEAVYIDREVIQPRSGAILIKVKML